MLCSLGGSSTSTYKTRKKKRKGSNYVNRTFYDYDTNQRVAVVKSSGIDLAIAEDQETVYKNLKKELDKIFKQ